MSSLAATQSDSYYLPPEYFTSGAYKHKTPNQYQNSTGHLKNGIVRFELPYDGFCLKCQAHVGKGTRFNAKKTFKGEMYFTSKIWEFELKCRACADCMFLIKTNPKDRCFDYVRGIKKKIEEFDTVEAQTLGVIETDVDANPSGGIVPYSKKVSSEENITKPIHNNPIDKLENAAEGNRKALTEREEMEALLNLQSHTMFNDADSNSTLRSNYRVKRNDHKRRLAEAQSLGLGKGIVLGDKHDIKICGLEVQRRTFKKEEQNLIKKQKTRWSNVRAESIFSGQQNKVSGNKSKRISRENSRRIVDEVPAIAKRKKSLKSKFALQTNDDILISIPQENEREKLSQETEKRDNAMVEKESLFELVNYDSDSD